MSRSANAGLSASASVQMRAGPNQFELLDFKTILASQESLKPGSFAQFQGNYSSRESTGLQGGTPTSAARPSPTFDPPRLMRNSSTASMGSQGVSPTPSPSNRSSAADGIFSPGSEVGVSPSVLGEALPRIAALAGDKTAEAFLHAFEYLDNSHQGCLTGVDIKQLMEDLRIHPDEDIVELVVDEISGGVGEIFFDEFCGLGVAEDSETESHLKHAFDTFANKETGRIGPTELRRLFESLGEQVPQAESGQIIARVDSDGDGMLNFLEYLDLMNNGWGAEAGPISPPETSGVLSPSGLVSLAEGGEMGGAEGAEGGGAEAEALALIGSQMGGRGVVTLSPIKENGSRETSGAG